MLEPHGRHIIMHVHLSCDRPAVGPKWPPRVTGTGELFWAPNWPAALVAASLPLSSSIKLSIGLLGRHSLSVGWRPINWSNLSSLLTHAPGKRMGRPASRSVAKSCRIKSATFKRALRFQFQLAATRSRLNVQRTEISPLCSPQTPGSNLCLYLGKASWPAG